MVAESTRATDTLGSLLFVVCCLLQAENVCREWLSDHDKFLTQLEEMKTKIKSLKNMSAYVQNVLLSSLFPS